MKKFIYLALFLSLFSSPVQGFSIYLDPQNSGLYPDYSHRYLLAKPAKKYWSFGMFSLSTPDDLKKNYLRILKRQKAFQKIYLAQEDALPLEAVKDRLELARTLVEKLITIPLSRQNFDKIRSSLKALLEGKKIRGPKDLPPSLRWYGQVIRFDFYRQRGQIYQGYLLAKKLESYGGMADYFLLEKAKLLFQIWKTLKAPEWERELEKTLGNLVSSVKYKDQALFLSAKKKYYQGNLLGAVQKVYGILKNHTGGEKTSRAYKFLWKTLYPALSPREKNNLPVGLGLLLRVQYTFNTHGRYFAISKGDETILQNLSTPLSLLGQLFLGQYHYLKGHFFQASQSFQKAWEKGPTTIYAPKALYGLARTYRQLWKNSPTDFLRWINRLLARKNLKELLSRWAFHPLAVDGLAEMVHWRGEDGDLRDVLKSLQGLYQAYPNRGEEGKIYSLVDEVFVRHPQFSREISYSFLDKYFYNRKEYKILLQKYPHSYWTKRGIVDFCATMERKYPIFFPGGPRDFTREEKSLLQGCRKFLASEWKRVHQPFSALQLSRIAMIEGRTSRGDFWLNQGGGLCSEGMVPLLEWMRGNLLIQQGKWEAGCYKFLSLSALSEIYRTPALLRVALIAEKMGRYDLCLDIGWKLQREEDIQYLLDIRMTPEEIARYWKTHPLSPRGPLICYTLGVRYFRDHNYLEGRKYFTRLLQFKTPHSWREMAKIKLFYLARLQTLRSIARASKNSEKQARALFVEGKIYRDCSLLFYNRLLWKGGRAVAIYYDFPYASPDKKRMLRRYMKEHNTLEQSIAVYWELSERFPQSSFAPRALFTALKSYLKLRDFNTYYREKKWIATGASLVLARMVKAYPNHPLTERARKIYRKIKK